MQQKTIVCITMGVGKIFSKGGPVRDFPKIFSRGGPKVVKFGFYPSKLKKQPFFLIISKSKGGQGSLPPFPTPMCITKVKIEIGKKRNRKPASIINSRTTTIQCTSSFHIQFALFRHYITGVAKLRLASRMRLFEPFHAAL